MCEIFLVLVPVNCDRSLNIMDITLDSFTADNISVQEGTTEGQNITPNDAELLRMRLGERYMATGPLVALNVAYIVIFLSGLLGNLCTCVVIAKNRLVYNQWNKYLLFIFKSIVYLSLICEINCWYYNNRSGNYEND